VDAVWSSTFDPEQVCTRADAADPTPPLAGLRFDADRIWDDVDLLVLPTVGTTFTHAEVAGFLCEAYATTGALDITAGGGWRNYRLGGHS
jgi:hypothetical protein